MHLLILADILKKSRKFAPEFLVGFRIVINYVSNKIVS